ncbi:hypothetical protein HN873_063389, partial [Arachis hypogaea]
TPRPVTPVPAADQVKPSHTSTSSSIHNPPNSSTKHFKNEVQAEDIQTTYSTLSEFTPIPSQPTPPQPQPQGAPPGSQPSQVKPGLSITATKETLAAASTATIRLFKFILNPPSINLKK